MDIARLNMLAEREDLTEGIKHRLAGSSEKTLRSILQRPGKRQKWAMVRDGGYQTSKLTEKPVD